MDAPVELRSRPPPSESGSRHRNQQHMPPGPCILRSVQERERNGADQNAADQCPRDWSPLKAARVREKGSPRRHGPIEIAKRATQAAELGSSIKSCIGFCNSRRSQRHSQHKHRYATARTGRERGLPASHGTRRRIARQKRLIVLPPKQQGQRNQHRGLHQGTAEPSAEAPYS